MLFDRQVARKPVSGFENYEIDELGQVWSNYSGKLLKISKTPRGYNFVVLYDTTNGNKLKKNYYIHRLVAEAFLSPIPDADTVDHIDHNKDNNAVSNLRWLSRSENTRREHRKPHKITDPFGNIHAFSCIREFCRENHLHRSGINDVMRGAIPHYKRWKKVA